METLAGQVVGDWSDKAVEKHKVLTENAIHEDRKAVYEAGRHSAESPMKHFIKAHRSQMSGDLKQDLIESVDGGYAKGNDFAGQTGNAPETG